MTITYKDQTQEQLPIATTQIYLAGTLASAHVMYATAFNITTSNVVIELTVTKSTSSAAQYVQRTVPAKGSVVISELVNRVLKTGDSIDGFADTASAINLDIGIKEIST